MEKGKKIRSKWLTVRLSEKEEIALNKLFEKTACNSLSEYARDVLLREPVIVKYRSQSADDFLAEMILLKKELNAIGHNFNQAVKRLHTLDHIAEIKSWLATNENAKQHFLNKTEQIKEKLNQIHRQWSQ